MGLSRLEQETGIIWNQAERDAVIWTTSPKWIRKFTKMFGEGKRKGTFCIEWKIPRTDFGINKKRRMSESHKLALAKSLAKRRTKNAN